MPPHVRHSRARRRSDTPRHKLQAGASLSRGRPATQKYGKFLALGEFCKRLKGNDKFLTLAANLRKLYDTAPEEFRRLAKLRILGRRRAYYFVEIDRVFGGDQDMAVRLNRIGWTKLQIIAPYVTKENREELVALAEAHTAVNLKAIMRGKPPILGGRTVVLHFTKKQFAAFAEAILAHGATKNGAGFLDKERALTKALKKRKKKGDTKIPGASESGSSGCDLA